MNRAGHCLENSKRPRRHVDDIAQSVAASYSFLLSCILLLRSFVYFADLNACTDESSSCMLYQGASIFGIRVLEHDTDNDLLLCYMCERTTPNDVQTCFPGHCGALTQSGDKSREKSYKQNTNTEH